MKYLLIMLMIATVSFAQTDFNFKPYVKSEFLIAQQLSDSSKLDMFIGETKLGAQVKNNNVSADITIDYADTLSLWKSYINIDFNLLDITGGKTVIPFGEFSTNLVTLPYTKTKYKESKTGLVIHSVLPGDFDFSVGAFKTDSTFIPVSKISWMNTSFGTSIYAKENAIGGHVTGVLGPIEPYVEFIKEFNNKKFTGHTEFSYYTYKKTALTIGANIDGEIDDFKSIISLAALKPLNDYCVIGIEINNSITSTNKHVDDNEFGLIGLISLEI